MSFLSELNKELEAEETQSTHEGGVTNPDEPAYSTDEACDGIEKKLEHGITAVYESFSVGSEIASEHRDRTHKVWYQKHYSGMPMILHICRPSRLWAAIKRGNKEATYAHSGYVIDNQCQRCRRELPTELREVLKSE